MNINDRQKRVLSLAGDWVKSERTPIPQRYILLSLSRVDKMPVSTVKASLKALIKKGYIRRAVAREASYVQLRTV